jgi:hypothetical protein
MRTVELRCQSLDLAQGHLSIKVRPEAPYCMMQVKTYLCTAVEIPYVPFEGFEVADAVKWHQFAYDLVHCNFLSLQSLVCRRDLCAMLSRGISLDVKYKGWRCIPAN